MSRWWWWWWWIHNWYFIPTLDCQTTSLYFHSLTAYIAKRNLQLNNHKTDTTNITLHWIAHFFEAKLTRPRSGWGQLAEAKPLRPRPRPKFWPWGLKITRFFLEPSLTKCSVVTLLYWQEMWSEMAIRSRLNFQLQLLHIGFRNYAFAQCSIANPEILAWWHWERSSDGNRNLNFSYQPEWIQGHAHQQM